MSRLPGARESKATRCPSGDQRGEPTSGPPNEVSGAGFRPSESHIQISLLPVLAEAKTTFLLSGEYCGPKSCRVDEINLVGPDLSFVPSRSIRQMFVSRNSCEYARRSPLREMASVEANSAQ